MIRRSLRFRLLLFAGLAIAAALSVTWVAMGVVFERHQERRLVEDLTRSGIYLVGNVHLDAKSVPVADLQLTDSRFENPGSGLYWSLRTSAGSDQSRSLWDASLPTRGASRTGWREHAMPGPFERKIILVERLVKLTPEGPEILVQIAADKAPLDRAADEFREELSVFLILLWLALAAAAGVQVHLGLRPLRRLSTDLGEMTRSPARRLETPYPVEIQGLIDAINGLADAREEDVRRARRRAADLAHALKTPLAALAALSRQARKAGAIDAAEGIDRTLASAGAAVETELARARAAAHRQRAETETCRVSDQVESLFAVLNRTEAGMRLVYETDVAQDFSLPLDNATFTEIVGNLLDNATRYAKRQVLVSAGTETTSSFLTVADDGPGIADQQIDAVLVRGSRLDESGGGHGLGLSIVRDLVQATGGTITLGTSALGGLAVILRWPSNASSESMKSYEDQARDSWISIIYQWFKPREK